MKRFLLISSSFFLIGCASYVKRHGLEKTDNAQVLNNLYFSNNKEDYVYKASVEVYDKLFGGIFIVKKINDFEHRVVFTTEMGNKIFDFSFVKEKFQVNYILDELNKKILLNVLKKDIKVLITENLNIDATYVNNNEKILQTIIDRNDYFYFGEPQINKIIRTNHGKEKVMFTFSEISDNIAKYIQIEHFNIKFKMTLKYIN